MFKLIDFLFRDSCWRVIMILFEGKSLHLNTFFKCKAGSVSCSAYVNSHNTQFSIVFMLCYATLRLLKSEGIDSSNSLLKLSNERNIQTKHAMLYWLQHPVKMKVFYMCCASTFLTIFPDIYCIFVNRDIY